MMEKDCVSAEIADWSREGKKSVAWNPARSLLASIRAYQKYSFSRNPWHRVLKYVAILRHRIWSVLTGADIPINCHIEGGLLLPHPNGIVIHPDASIGPNCLIFQQVTIGTRGKGGAPTIGGHVDIGAGAKILGPVKIGNHAVIGANAVVMSDVPDNCIAVGVPAIVKPRRGIED